MKFEDSPAKGERQRNVRCIAGCCTSFKRQGGCRAKRATVWLAPLPPAPKGETQRKVRYIAGCCTSFRRLGGSRAKKATVWLAALPPTPKGKTQCKIRCLAGCCTSFRRLGGSRRAFINLYKDCKKSYSSFMENTNSTNSCGNPVSSCTSDSVCPSLRNRSHR